MVASNEANDGNDGNGANEMRKPHSVRLQIPLDPSEKGEHREGDASSSSPKDTKDKLNGPDKDLEKGAGGDGAEADKRKDKTGKKKKKGFTLPKNLKWIPDNWTWSKIKPALRSALSAWISIVLFAIPKVEVALGQASFLLLIASFLSPPSDPFIAVVEREFLLLLGSSLAWAWFCLGLYLANLARTNVDTTATLVNIITGAYIEAAPTIILAVFIFLGISFFLYVKAVKGPGPFLFGTIFGCIGTDIMFTTAVLYPYPSYKIGQIIVVPLAVHSAVAIVSSILFFPSTVSALFTARCQGVIGPLITSIDAHRKVLKLSIDDPAFTPTAINAAVNQSEGALVPLAAAARLMRADIIWGRFAPTDYADTHNVLRRLAVRANGMGIYFTLIDSTREKFPVTPAPSHPGTPRTTPSRPGTPAMTPRHSRAPSRERDGARTPDSPRVGATGDGSASAVSSSSNLKQDGVSRRRVHVKRHSLVHPGWHMSHSHPHPPHDTHHHHTHLHSSLMHLALSRSPQREQPVGVFESQRWADLEATHWGHDAQTHAMAARATALLGTSCDELLGACGDGLRSVNEWFVHARDDRWAFWRGKSREKASQERIRRFEELRDRLLTVLDEFRSAKRLMVLEPYRHAFDPDYPPEVGPVPPHRLLFHSYVYHYHLGEFTVRLLDIIVEIIRLERERKRNVLWTPWNSMGNTSWLTWGADDNMEHNDEEDPESIPGMQAFWMRDLGDAQGRDPDALPPSNTLEKVFSVFYSMTAGLGGGNALYALKAGALTVILCLPSFLKQSARFAYAHKFVWAIFMGQLTLSRFRGDTSFGIVSRIFSTFSGGIVGMTMWYISTGNGHGNPYGLCAVTAVCFPFFFYARLYWPGPPMTNLIFFVTSALVLGYSYQDNIIILPSSPGWGWDVAWRRFLLVAAGVVAAGIFSFLPPSTTIRRYQRRALSTVSGEIGALYCSILSFANSTRRDADTQEIVLSLIAIRAKLKRSLLLRKNVIYEFSLRGKWPLERYHTILEILLQISYSLSHLMSVVEHLDPAWTQAFLKRTRFLDSDFQGDVLAVIMMISTSLKSGQPLPQITPCPLVDRFLVRHHGLNVIEKESEDDYGLPRMMTISTLENEQYSMFCVGVSTAFAMISRLDRLMLAVKELVGEQYHIHGVGLRRTTEAGSIETPWHRASFKSEDEV